ncbi:MAG TPA: DNA polymerase III subunit delta' [Stellaceae bacterium]|jgi:DNA polymerase-3 subunit delta'|nr:DNA polymerase III subunit delta' [Stellaceae bacterium]
MAEDDDDLEADEERGDAAEAAVPAPRENSNLSGHEPAEKELLSAFASGRLPHGLLITGAHGIGKATLAFRFARFLLSQSAEPSAGGLFGPAVPNSLTLPPEHPVFRRVASSGHADLLTVERGIDPKRKRERTEIVVEDTRAIAAFLRLTPAEGGWRIVIVDTADEMNRNAANAVLKILEEPPDRAILILVSDNPGRLLPTIRSRCRRVALRPLSDTVVAELIGRYRPDLSVSDRAALIELAEGSIGHALELAEQNGLRLHRQLIELLGTLPEINGAALHEFADTVARWGADDAFRVIAELMPATLARAIARAARSGSAGEGREAALARLMARRGLDRWVEVWEKIADLFAQADAVNLDRKQVVLNAFFALEEAAR